MSTDGRHIDITSTDKILLRTALNILGKSSTKVSSKSNGAGGRAWRVQIGDVVFYDWLRSIGLAQRKSLTISHLDIPDKYFSDFVRGLWDGDGTVYSYFDPRWGTHMYYIAFATGSEAFAKWLHKKTAQLARVRGHMAVNRASRPNPFFQVRFAKTESEVVFRWMFYRKGLPHLPRKFAKMQKILTIESLQVDKRLKNNRSNT
jgi:hypothetical protein